LAEQVEAMRAMLVCSAGLTHAQTVGNRGAILTMELLRAMGLNSKKVDDMFSKL
jgi:hypothetical protein